ncbi:MAG: hypothetical protein LBV75_07430 [Paludibacter sp.]|jgi:signal transduction histidine kinase|nr:hypothetical protein [Paludibacter sp.]
MYKKNLITILIIILIDIVIIGCWTCYIKPSEDMAIVLIFYIPIIFVINIIIAVVIYFIKKYYTAFFILNAVISSVMMFWFFGWYITIDRKIHRESWEFFIDNAKYYIDYGAKDIDSTYSITYSYEVGTSQSCPNGRGIVCVNKDTVYFYAVDSAQYYIYDNYLYNFKNIDKIKVKKRY